MNNGQQPHLERREDDRRCARAAAGAANRGQSTVHRILIELTLDWREPKSREIHIQTWSFFESVVFFCVDTMARAFNKVR